MTFARVTSIATDITGAKALEREARRLWVAGRGEVWSECASVLREAIDAVPWAERVVDRSPKVCQR